MFAIWGELSPDNVNCHQPHLSLTIQASIDHHHGRRLTWWEVPERWTSQVERRCDYLKCYWRVCFPSDSSIYTTDLNRIKNPLIGIPKEQLLRDVEDFAIEHQLTDIKPWLIKGALVAQSPHHADKIQELDEEDVRILNEEVILLIACHDPLLRHVGYASLETTQSSVYDYFSQFDRCSCSRMGSNRYVLLWTRDKCV